MLEGITKSLKKNQKVTLVGFGTFSTSRRKARKGRNPQTGEVIKIKAKKIAKFKPGKKRWESDGLFLKELVFRPGGQTEDSEQTWTRGLVLDSDSKTASRYLLREIGGATYMFYEWKSGDYTIRRRDPSYYVLSLSPNRRAWKAPRPSTLQSRSA